jgi:hypothetical protein
MNVIEFPIERTRPPARPREPREAWVPWFIRHWPLMICCAALSLGVAVDVGLNEILITEFRKLQN